MPFLSHQQLASVLESAVSTRSAQLGRAAHAHAVKSLGPISQNSMVLINHLVNMYSKLDRPVSAQKLVALTPTHLRSVVTWTALISGDVQNGHFASSLSHFAVMRHEGVMPNDFTFPCLFKAATGVRAPLLGRKLHGLAVKMGLVGDVFVGCSVYDMYCKLSMLCDSAKMFDEMPVRNIATWNACISNAVLSGRSREAVLRFAELFRCVDLEPNSITFCAYLNACSDGGMLKEGSQLHGYLVKDGHKNDVSVSNGLIDFYGKCGEIRSAGKVFDDTKEKNVVSWCSMLAVYEQNNMGEEACSIFFRARREGFEPTDFMLSSVLSACADLAALDVGRMVHGLAVKACVEESVFVGSALVDMYGKCGSIEDCQRAFYMLPVRNLICWNALIGAYAHQGRANMALELFERMVHYGDGARLMPNYVTFVCVLTACSRGGMVKIGIDIFDSMKERYGINPGAEHYACVVDMLGRAGHVDRAYRFISSAPIRPTISMWGALLNACKVHGKPELGKFAAEKLFQLDPQDSGNHVLLSNMFAASGQWHEANHVRTEMKDVGIKKGTGYSWISVKNTVHVFQAKDTSHSRNTEIQAVLEKLKKDMKAAGYVPETGLALYDVEDEERESEVWSHSEKIALAFGLIALPRGVPIRINKNLRICVDCHSAIKFVSGIVGREIIVRDNNRFHRFVDSRCSCGDYW